jgi:hypothetical protein
VNTATSFVADVVRLARSRKATTFYLNGAPGSGKSYLLHKAADLVLRQLGNAQILGPYHIQPSEDAKLCEHILTDCQDLGFVEPLDSLPKISNLVDTWLWLGGHMQAKHEQQFVVLVDLDNAGARDLTSLAALFSSARELEGRWDDEPYGVHIIFAAYWDEPTLETYYYQTRTSFPYSKERNSATWEGLAVTDLTQMMLKGGHNGVEPIHGQILYELTGGHAWTALDVLHYVPAGQLSISSLLAATEQAASSGEAGTALLTAWQHLPAECSVVLKDMVLRRQVGVSPIDTAAVSLRAAGAARLDVVGNKSYLRFRSWYTECLVRSHLEVLGLADPQTKAIRRNELMPDIRCMNAEAYCLINETENAVRNFVATHLSVVTTDDAPILGGRCKRMYLGIVEDTDLRASRWKLQSHEKGLPVELNPLIAFCSTTELAGLVREIADELHSNEWRAVSLAIEDLSEIRNSVMHNQIVDDRCLAKLHELRARVWEAVSQTSPPTARRATWGNLSTG